VYTGVVLNAESVAKLMGKFESEIPADWTVKAHHMTTNMGGAAKGPAKDFLGKTVLTSFSRSVVRFQCRIGFGSVNCRTKLAKL